MTWAGAPRVSILLPVRNGQRYLGAAIDSLRAQTFADFELIVIDDGGSDGSGALARDCDDARVMVIETGGIGVAGALNAGLAIARGELIARQDADDLSAPDRLARQVTEFDRRPDLTLVTSRVRFIDAAGHDTDTAWTRAVATQWEAAAAPADIATLLLRTNCIVHGSVMMRHESLLAVGGYDAALPVAQDYDLWLRLLPQGRFARVPDVLYAFRLHDTQISASKSREQARQAVAAKLRYLVANAGLAQTPSAHIVGDTRGVPLYREAIERAGWTEVSGNGDVTIFTDFETLERDMQAFLDRSAFPLTRVGNFLVSARA